jgi:hypothetical protein
MSNTDLASSIYEKFIEQDDEGIVKVMRRLFIIYKFKVRNVLLDRFLKWKLYCTNKPQKENKENSFSSLNIDRNDIYTSRPNESRIVGEQSAMPYSSERDNLIIETVNSQTYSPSSSVRKEIPVISRPPLYERLHRVIEELYRKNLPRK